MKYNIKINQKVLSYSKLTLSESAILNYLIDLCRSKSIKVKAQKRDGYTWVNIKHLIREMPLLRIKSKSTVALKIHNIRRAGFIEVARNNKNWLYVKLLWPVNMLYQKDMAVRYIKQGYSTIRPGSVRNFAHNHYTNDNTTKDVEELGGSAPTSSPQTQEPQLSEEPNERSENDYGTGTHVVEYEGEWLNREGAYYSK